MTEQELLEILKETGGYITGSHNFYSSPEGMETVAHISGQG